MVSDLSDRCRSTWSLITDTFTFHSHFTSGEMSMNRGVACQCRKLAYQNKTLKYSCCHNEKENEKISNRWFSFHTPAFSFVLFPSFSKNERPALLPEFLPIWLIDTELEPCQITSHAILGSLWGQRWHLRVLWPTLLSALIYSDHYQLLRVPAHSHNWEFWSLAWGQMRQTLNCFLCHNIFCLSYSTSIPWQLMLKVLVSIPVLASRFQAWTPSVLIHCSNVNGNHCHDVTGKLNRWVLKRKLDSLTLWCTVQSNDASFTNINPL